MPSKIQKKLVLFLSSVLVFALLISLRANTIVHADFQTSVRILDELKDLGYKVASDADEINRLVEELTPKPISERILFISESAIQETSPEALGSIYELGILLVAIDTPIRSLYEDSESVTICNYAQTDSIRKDLEDIVSPDDSMSVVSMIYSYNYIPGISGYYHYTNFHVDAQNLIAIANEITNSAEEEYHFYLDYLGDELQQSVSMSFGCSVTASISWSNGSNPGTKPTGKAKCYAGFKPFHIRVYGTMSHDCGGMHQVGSTDKWNDTPYTISEISGQMTGFPFR